MILVAQSTAKSGKTFFIQSSDLRFTGVSEVLEWIDENADYPYKIASQYHSHTVHFTYKTDAVGFKLRWVNAKIREDYDGSPPLLGSS